MKVMKFSSHLLIILSQPQTTQKAKGDKRLIEAQLYPLEISGHLPLYMVLRGLPPYICFWEGCSLIYVSLEGLSGKKKAIEAQLYPKGEVVTGYPPCRGMDTFWPLKHNCTQIRGEQTTDQGDELYSFFGHSSIIVPYLASSMAFASLSFIILMQGPY